MKTQVTEAPVSEVEQAGGGATTGEDATVKPVKALPPLLAGAVQAIAIEVVVVPAEAVTPVGAPGVVAGMAAAEGAEAPPAPTPLVAVTVNV